MDEQLQSLSEKVVGGLHKFVAHKDVLQELNMQASLAFGDTLS